MSEMQEPTTPDPEAGSAGGPSGPDGPGCEEHRAGAGRVESDGSGDLGHDAGGEDPGAVRSAQGPETVAKPRDWDKVLAVAYLRTLETSQEASAVAVGVGRRTVQRWEQSDWWPEAVAQSADNWLGTLKLTALASVQRGCAEDPAVALRVAERIIPELAPPAQRNINSDLDDLPWEIFNEAELERLENQEDPAAVVAAARARLMSEESHGDQEA